MRDVQVASGPIKLLIDPHLGQSSQSSVNLRPPCLTHCKHVSPVEVYGREGKYVFSVCNGN